MKKYGVILAAAALFGAPLVAQAADDKSGSGNDAAQSQEQLEKQLEQARAQLQADARKVANLSAQINSEAMSNLRYIGLRRGRHERRGYLGVDMSEVNDNGSDNGAIITGVSAGSPADKAGLKPGDVITGMNGTEFKPSDDQDAVDKMMDFMDGVKPGDSLKVAYTRDGKAATATLTAGDVRDALSNVTAYFPGFGRGAVLGVNVGNGDAAGAQIDGVTPEGPADKAGLRAGDVITAVNGAAIKPRDNEGARSVLEEFMHKAKPGDELTVTYSRDGKSATTKVVAGSPEDFFYSFNMPPMPPMPAMPPMPPMPTVRVNPGFGGFMFGGRPGSDMQLVPLTAELGQYFGTDKGLLVVRASHDADLPLKDGDVILAIGGRDPGSAPHAMRILSSYGPGESVKLDIMRKGKPVTLNVTLPKRAGRDDSTAFNLYLPGFDDTADDR